MSFVRGLVVSCVQLVEAYILQSNAGLMMLTIKLPVARHKRAPVPADPLVRGCAMLLRATFLMNKECLERQIPRPCKDGKLGGYESPSGRIDERELFNRTW